MMYGIDFSVTVGSGRFAHDIADYDYYAELIECLEECAELIEVAQRLDWFNEDNGENLRLHIISV